METIIHNSQLPFNREDISSITFEKAKLKSRILRDIFLSNDELKKILLITTPI